MRHCLRVFPLLAIALFGASSAFATPVIYTFDAPQFTVGQTTPLLNVAPNSGPAGFLTSFTASPTSNGFVVFPAGAPNVLFDGPFLIDPAVPPDTLFLTFNTPIFSLQVDFGQDILSNTPPGSFRLVTPVGTTTVATATVGGTFQGGTLVFSSAVPFMTAQLLAFNAAGAPVFFAIDDLILNTEMSSIPEPVTGVLVLSGLGLIARDRLRRRKTT